MPKRSFPFNSCSPLQMKMHVNIMHVDKEAYMLKVYEKTQDLLIKGAIQLYGGEVQSCENGLRCPGCASSKVKLTEACVFCTKRVCSSCCRTCEKCGGNFCGVCSTVNYDQRDERIFCLGCQ